MLLASASSVLAALLVSNAAQSTTIFPVESTDELIAATMKDQEE